MSDFTIENGQIYTNDQGVKQRIDFHEGPGITFTVSPDYARDATDITISAAGGAGNVPSTRRIDTTAPLAGGGDLSADRTLSITGSALTKTDDTNVTLTLGGSPADALLAATSLTLGWTGTLAAARLNPNVVQGVTNDTNVTGVISAQNLTLGWTGTLAAARLNANVVQGVTNDTNITGSISAQNLTLGFTGTLAAARLNANVVQSVVNDTNVTGSIAAQALTLGWAGQLAISRGGTSAATALGAFNALSPLTTRGDLLTRDASNNVRLAVGGSGTILRSNGTDPAWVSLATAGAVSGSGTLNRLAMWTPDGVTMGDGPLVWDPALRIIYPVVDQDYHLGSASFIFEDVLTKALNGGAFDLTFRTLDGSAGTIDRLSIGGGVDNVAVQVFQVETWAFDNRLTNFTFGTGGAVVDGVHQLNIQAFGGAAGEIYLYEPVGPNSTSIQAQTQSADISYTLPAAAAVGVLHNSGANVWSWGAVALGSEVSGDLPFANLTQGSARSVLGVTGNATADVASIQGAANQVLVVNSGGTALSFGAVNLASSSAVTGDLPFSNLTQGSARSVLGVTGNATADVAIIQGAANQVLVVNSGGTALAFGQVNLASSAAVTGTLPVANGGTGLATFTSNVVYKGAGTSALAASTITDDGTDITLTNGSIRSGVASSVSALKLSTLNNLGVQTGRLQIASGQTAANTQLNFLNCGTVNFNSSNCQNLLSIKSNSPGSGDIGGTDAPWGNLYVANVFGGDDWNTLDFVLNVMDGNGAGTSVELMRVPLSTSPLTATFSGHLTFADARNIAFNATTGTKIGTATTQKLAFYNSTPIVQRSGAAQAAVATTAATNVAPFGYTTQAQADAIVTLVNELRAAMVALGLIKGSA